MWRGLVCTIPEKWTLGSHQLVQASSSTMLGTAASFVIIILSQGHWMKVHQNVIPEIFFKFYRPDQQHLLSLTPKYYWSNEIHPSCLWNTLKIQIFTHTFLSPFILKWGLFFQWLFGISVQSLVTCPECDGRPTYFTGSRRGKTPNRESGEVMGALTRLLLHSSYCSL